MDRGSDERQYNSPGIDLPIASIFRTMYGKYPEYHTSLDNFDLVNIKGLSGGFKILKTAITILLNLIVPKVKILCEPQMGKRNLYPHLSQKNKQTNKKLHEFSSICRRKNDLKNISNIIKLKFKDTLKYINY